MTEHPTPSPGAAHVSRVHPAAWLMWGLGAMMFCHAFFQRVAPGVMIDDLMRDFAIDAAVLGNLSAIYFWSYALMQIPAGALVDGAGSRRVLVLSAFCSALGALGFAFTGDLWLAYMARLMIGVGAGFTFVATLKLAGDWFPPGKLAQMGGMTLGVGVLGGVLGQAPLAWAVEVWGWRESMMGAAAFVIVWGGMIAVLMRDKPDPLSGARANYPFRQTLSGSIGVLRHGPTWLAALAGFGCVGVLLAFGGLWAVPYLQITQGLSRPEAAGMASLVLFGMVLGGPVIGSLSDKMKRRRGPFLCAMVTLTASFGVLIYAPGLGLRQTQALIFICGFCSGAVAIIHAVGSELNPPERRGAGVALVNGMMLIAGAVCQPLIGLILDANWSGRLEAGVRVYDIAAYQLAFLTLVGMGGVATFFGMVTPETHCRPVAASQPAARGAPDR